MRRANGLWPQVASFDALCAAARRAARGKRSGHAVATYLERLEPEALQLERELLTDTWRPSPIRQFVIHDPKRRTITAVPFRDRVVHLVKEALRVPGYLRYTTSRCSPTTRPGSGRRSSESRPPCATSSTWH